MPQLKLEQLHVEQFLKALQICVDAKVQKPPEPDFIIELNDRVIGIEHTRLIRDKDKNGVNIMAHSKYADQIMQKAELLFNKNASLCLMIHADFDCSYGLATTFPLQLIESDVERLSSFIYNFIFDRLELIESIGHMGRLTFDSYNFETFEQILPHKLNYLSITNTCNFKNSCWSANQGGIVPSIFDSREFNNLLFKKNTKPANYKNTYDELWLLIVEDSMDLTSYFHFDDQTIPHINSSYDKVFIPRRSENVVIKLTT